MEFKLLRAFIVLAQELHFGRAAQRLSIVQPALSMQIKALEEQIGARLFDRDRHSVALSETGRIFLPEARATLHQSARALDIARASGRGEVGNLRVAFVSSVLPDILPTLIRTLHQRYPRIELELKDMSSLEQIRVLRDGQLDFGLVRLPVAAPAIQTRVILREPFVVAMPSEHVLAGQEQVLAAQLGSIPCYLLARRFAPGMHDELLAAFAQLGTQLHIAAELGEYTTMLALVAAGLGFGIVPAAAARALPPNVTARPIELGGHQTALGLAWTELDTPIKRTLHALMQELFT
ncbi:LysR substrate-binding domain-containing protein [Pseudomonas putida]